jgi:hypothetical protein
MPRTAADRPDPRQPAKVVAAARDILAADGCAEADRVAMRLLVSQFAARSGLPPLLWPALAHPADPDAAYAARRHLAGLVMDGWDMCDISAAYEHLLSPKQRVAKAAFYTPPEAAAAMVRLSLGQAADMLAADRNPRALLRILAVDPACGAGVFLVEAGRFIAAAFAARLAGRPDPQLARVMMPDVMTASVFGMDIDPVAVDLARAALWLEMGGGQPIGFMDRNVVVVNPLSGPDAQPPGLAERLGDDPAAAARVCGLQARQRTPHAGPQPAGKAAARCDD